MEVYHEKHPTVPFHCPASLRSVRFRLRPAPPGLSSQSILALVGSGPRIGVINSARSGLRWIAAEAVEPNWSLSGRQIVYRKVSYDHAIYLNSGYGEIWTMNRDGSNKRQVTYSIRKTFP